MTEPITINRVSDLSDSQHIVAFCGDCDRPGDRLNLAKLDPDLELTTLYRRLTCTECGSRNTSTRLMYDTGGNP